MLAISHIESATDLTKRACQHLLNATSDNGLASRAGLRQEDLTRGLAVSRQPVFPLLRLLKADDRGAGGAAFGAQEMWRALLQPPTWAVMPRSGYFAAFEEPDRLAEDIGAFFRSLRG